MQRPSTTFTARAAAQLARRRANERPVTPSPRTTGFDSYLRVEHAIQTGSAQFQNGNSAAPDLGHRARVVQDDGAPHRENMVTMSIDRRREDI